MGGAGSHIYVDACIDLVLHLIEKGGVVELAFVVGLGVVVVDISLLMKISITYYP